MFVTQAKQLALSAATTAILVSSPLTAFAYGGNSPPTGKMANINLAVASNFYGSPPSNSAIKDLINEFEAENPDYTVTVTDNGATATLEQHIIDGNQYQVDLFLAADTATPLDLYTNHFKLVAPYNTLSNPYHDWSNGSSFTPPLYTFNYEQGILALFSDTPGVDVSCDAGGTCGYNPKVYSTVAIADPSLAPYGVAAQSVLIGIYGL
jgi:ABC-type molybdate transport system substrate-binding protein